MTLDRIIIADSRKAKTRGVGPQLVPCISEALKVG